jgi:hypothetical protein
MKTLMSLMLGLSLIVGTTALFGQTPAPDDSKKSTTKKAKKKKKTTDDTTKKTS